MKKNQRSYSVFTFLPLKFVLLPDLRSLTWANFARGAGKLGGLRYDPLKKTILCYENLQVQKEEIFSKSLLYVWQCKEE